VAEECTHQDLRVAQVMLMAEAAICVFAKPPVPGRTKTRLIPGIGATGAAELAEAFLRDTLGVLEKLGWAEPIIAATVPFEREYMRNYQIWVQPEGTLDIRLEAMLKRALFEYPMAFALGTDSPGLPIICLDQARQQLASHDAVLGPSMDGGFYLIGVKHCPLGLLSGIEWSRPSTLQETQSRLQRQGLSVARVPEWFDVDTAVELSHLESLLVHGLIDCPHTRVALENIRPTNPRMLVAK
jgi:rSAM/selenodomain-associated transferase 1